MVKFCYFWKTRQGLGTGKAQRAYKNRKPVYLKYDFLRWGAIEALLFTASFEQFVEYAISKNKLPGTLIETFGRK